MKLATQNNNFVSSSGQSDKFTITDTKKVIGILTKELYSNKPWSITKEIWQNALDAHIIAGIADKPFSVSFPATFDPAFRVRDYGNSMDHEFMLNQYTWVGYSTKDETNELNGAFGLGRLVPLCYVDAYSVTTYVNGVKRFYSVSISDGDISITFLGEDITDEPDGTEVSFPINRHDVDSFKRAAEVVSLGFDVKPSITNTSDIDWPVHEAAFEGEGYKVLKTEKMDYHHPMRACAYVRMGCVVYSLSNAPHEAFENSGLKSTPILIEAPIGSLSVTSSRESLSFDDKTINSIRKISSTIGYDVVERLEKELQQEPTYYDACKKYEAVPYTLKKMFGSANLKYHGRRLSTSWNEGFFWDYGATLKGFDRYTNGIKLCNGGYFTTSNDTPKIVVINKEDKDIRVVQRVKKAYEDGKLPNTVVWFEFDGTNGKDLIKLMEDWPFEAVLVADLEDPGPASKGTQVRYAKKWDVWFGSWNWQDYELTDDDKKKGGYYIPTLRKEPTCGLSSGKAVNLLGQLMELGEISEKVIVGAPKSVVKKFEEDPKWTSVNDIVERYKSDKHHKTYEEYYTHEAKVQAYRQAESTFSKFSTFGCSVPQHPGANPNLKWKGLASTLGDYSVYHSKVEHWEKHYRDTMKQLLDKYPLLRYYSGNDLDEFKKYKQLVDKGVL